MRSAESTAGESATAIGRDVAIRRSRAEGTNMPGENVQDGRPASVPTINELAGAYLEDRRFNVSAFDSLAYSLKPIVGHLGEVEAAAIDRALVRSYTATRRSNGRADGTIDKELRTLRQVLSFAVKEGCIDSAPYIDTPGSGPPRDRWLDERELQRLIEACVAPHVRAFVLISVHTGARARQVYDLTWDRVELRSGLVCFPPSRPRSKKRSVIIPANETLWAELRSLRKVSKGSWVIEHRGQHVGSVKTGFKAAVRRAGIAPCTIHDLRRTCASRLLQRGASFAEVADFLGDSEAMIRRVYGHFSPQGRRAELWLEVGDGVKG